jgi:hypothetical protein
MIDDESGLIEVLSQTMRGETEGQHENLSQVSLCPSRNSKVYVPNTRLQRYRYANPFGFTLSRFRCYSERENLMLFSTLVPLHFIRWF